MAPADISVPTSILDTDLYKLTMQAAVLHHFPTVPAVYKFTLRDKQISFTPHFVDILKGVVSHFTNITLQPAEREWLQSACPYFTPEYLDYLSAYRFKPEQVQITFRGTIDVVMSGPWVETILWEVPILACISETYYNTIEEDWNYDGQEDIAYSKAKALQEGGCVYMEFGTRRRRTFHAQDIMVGALVRASTEMQSRGRLMGTICLFSARRSLLRLTLTCSEWFMGVAALKGYETANSLALELWEQTFPDSRALIALTDTFSTGAFFKSFVQVPDLARRWTGLRQDSGDPFTFSPRAKAVTKTITFSDGLDVEKALKLQKQSEEIGFKASFGIGTFLSNDFCKASSGGKEKSKAMNMVIKLASVDGKPCVKISDDLTKNTGDETEVRKVKGIFGLPV
ncbi:nicotinate phosphoribosyltransferase [Armillaria borealis]|uniref:Nicotinate phosphoribosyltransferase n=1 Tax=Armillaria borealis TaxID=47425 RepID=A0AA39MX98_9AGAR|nr:nicotinate phosphoribosyltransferase [Armillaria borealis]